MTDHPLDIAKREKKERGAALILKETGKAPEAFTIRQLRAALTDGSADRPPRLHAQDKVVLVEQIKTWVTSERYGGRLLAALKEQSS